MAKLSINETYIINGKMSLKRFLDEEGNINILGTLATHYYFDEIKSIESYRYEINNIEVYEELFGSDDFDIVYNFKAKNLNIKNGISILDEKEIEKIEFNLYNEEGYILDSNMIYIKEKDRGEK